MLRRLILFVLAAALLASTQPTLLAQAKPANAVDAEGHQWWQHAVFYELYPRSFADSNNDGIGDLKGITAKLAYLHDLGVDAIWIAPCFPSPQVDFGYDVSDYENIDPMYGTLADFDVLTRDAHKRNLKIILDFVVNHTSDQHPWFQDSKSAKTAPHRDWYVWHDGEGPGKPPNNWISEFGGSAWKFDPTTNQFYYHFFYTEQPDLNWRNPAVEKAMFDVTRWWYRRGVSGFRLDAVATIFEDPDLRDNPPLPGTTKLGDPRQERKYNNNLPEHHEVLRGLRKVADQNNAVLVGETTIKTVEGLKSYYGANGDELQLPMDFMFMDVNKLSPAEFRRQIAAVDNIGGWPVYLLSNHDQVRHVNRYGDGVHNDDIAKMLAAFYLTLRGTPIMYYGEEIGMENNDPKRKEDVKDPVGRRGWPEEKGRDGERTPMQWNDKPNAGFSSVGPWLPVSPNYSTHNVATESKDPNSILNFYKKVLALRHTNPALLDGTYTALNESDDNVISYLRNYKGRAVLVALNMSSFAAETKIRPHCPGLLQCVVQVFDHHSAGRRSRQRGYASARSVAQVRPPTQEELTREVQPPKKFAFSGTVTESDCHSLPARSFEIRPAGPRWKTADRLLIECIPDRTKSGSFTLTLTFTITDPPPPPPDYGNREYDFRSGAAIVPRNPSRLRGEFTDDFERCTRFATLFKEKVSQDVVSTSEHLRSSPHWSAEWAGEDQWGVAMELTLSGKFPESL